MAIKVNFHFEIIGSGVETVLAVKSIRRSNEKVPYYLFPLRMQTAQQHQQLLDIKSVKTAISNMTKIGQYRNLNVTLTDPLKSLYLDEDDNFVFNNVYLEEANAIPTPEEINITSNSQSITTTKPVNTDINLADIERKFNIDKFTGKENAKEWMSTFEQECLRFQIIDTVQKITVLKLFLEVAAKDWYASSLIKFSTTNWQDWADSFEKVFATKGWSQVRYAYTYRFMAGSLVDYALKKERLCLEVESQMSIVSRIHHIVVGLPMSVQDKLDKENIHTTDALMNELRRYEVNFMSKSNASRQSQPKPVVVTNKPSTSGQTQYDRKPCYICEKLGKPGRYHPSNACRNKKTNFESMQVNFNDGSDIDQFTKLELQEEKN